MPQPDVKIAAVGRKGADAGAKPIQGDGTPPWLAHGSNTALTNPVQSGHPRP